MHDGNNGYPHGTEEGGIHVVGDVTGRPRVVSRQEIVVFDIQQERVLLEKIRCKCLQNAKLPFLVIK